MLDCPQPQALGVALSARPGLLTQSVNVDGRACTIVGVLDPSIEFGNLSLTDVWMPIAADPAAGRRDDRRYSVVGRLKPGVTLEQADGEIRTITERLAREFPATNAGWSARVAPTRRRSPAATHGSSSRCCRWSSGSCSSSRAPT